MFVNPHTKDEAEEIINTLKQECSGVLFDVKQENWNPSPDFLDIYLRLLFRDVVYTYKELEKTQKYKITSEVFLSRGNSGEIFSSSYGGGYTHNALINFHTTEWDFVFTIRKYKENPEPFYLRFFSGGYSDYESENSSRIKITERGKRLSIV